MPAHISNIIKLHHNRSIRPKVALLLVMNLMKGLALIPDTTQICYVEIVNYILSPKMRENLEKRNCPLLQSKEAPNKQRWQIGF